MSKQKEVPKVKEGDLVRIIDDNGDDRGVGMFMERFRPIDRGLSKIDLQEGQLDATYMFTGRSFIGHAPTFWHYEVLWEGELRWLNTDHFTLISML
ncbi:hypothetical protein CMI47_19325 [Candidatus Pacearchaeota archaeon]|nr:hypothetical protein [Candidatus Pacearchaeota archaeon]